MAVDFTITAERIDQGRFSIETTERVDLVNRAQATYYRRWVDLASFDAADGYTVREADSSGISKYGVLYNDSVFFPFITAQAQAQDVISWLVLDRGETRYLARFAGGPWLQQIEIGDVVCFDPTGSAEFTAALLGLVTASEEFRVLNVNRPADGTIEIVAVQIRTPSRLLLEDGTYMELEDGGYIEI